MLLYKDRLKTFARGLIILFKKYRRVGSGEVGKWGSGEVQLYHFSQVMGQRWLIALTPNPADFGGRRERSFDRLEL
jgi:hypothetical protein